MNAAPNSMRAGSSPDTGTDLPGFVIPITEPPIVEIDNEATAAYVRHPNSSEPVPNRWTKLGREEKSKEFVDKGAEVYAKV